MQTTIFDVFSALRLATCLDENVGTPGRRVIHGPQKMGLPHDHREEDGLSVRFRLFDDGEYRSS